MYHGDMFTDECRQLWVAVLLGACRDLSAAEFWRLDALRWFQDKSELGRIVSMDLHDPRF
jgi:hypothetical protein